MNYLNYLILKAFRKIRVSIAGTKGSASYWTSHMVANDDWQNVANLLDHFNWRNQQYLGYIGLMPVLHCYRPSEFVEMVKRHGFF